MKRHVLAALLSTAAMFVFSAQGLQAQELDETISIEIDEGGFVDYGDGGDFSIVIVDDGSEIAEPDGTGSEVGEGEGADGGEPILVICPSEIGLPETGEYVELIDPPMDRGGEDCAECRDFTGAEPVQVSATSEVVAAMVVLMSDDQGGLATPELVNCSTKANARRSVCLASVAD